MQLLIFQPQQISRNSSSSNPCEGYTGCPKKTQFSGILAITPLWKGLELKVGVFQKLQEILYVIGTEIFQIDLLKAQKIGSKDGNSTKKILKKN